MSNLYKPKTKLKLLRDELLTDINPRGLSMDDMVSKLKAKLIGRHPFWGVLIAPISVSFSDSVPTACTDGERIIFGTEFFLNLTWTEAAFVIAHEVWHMANLHIPRLQARDPQLWNIATDHWINLLLQEEANNNNQLFSVPDFPRIMNNPQSGLYMDSKYTDWAPEAIYAQIIRDRAAGTPDESDMENAMDGDLDYESGQSDSKESQEEKAKRLESQWNKRLAAAADAGRKAGNLPGSLARWVEEHLTPKVDWQSTLAAYLSFQPTDFEWTNPDRRFTDWPFVVPDIVGDKLKLIAAIDTSGSISDDMIKEFISELHSILTSFQHVEGVLIGHDHEVHDVIEFDKAEPPTGFTGGGGGTDFHCVMQEIEDNHETPAVFIHFTDLYATIPPKPNYPVIYVLVNTPLEAPEWATGIHIQTE